MPAVILRFKNWNDENFNGVPGKHLSQSFGRRHFEAQGTTSGIELAD